MQSNVARNKATNVCHQQYPSQSACNSSSEFVVPTVASAGRKKIQKFVSFEPSNYRITVRYTPGLSSLQSLSHS